MPHCCFLEDFSFVKRSDTEWIFVYNYNQIGYRFFITQPEFYKELGITIEEYLFTYITRFYHEGIFVKDNVINRTEKQKEKILDVYNSCNKILGDNTYLIMELLEALVVDTPDKIIRSNLIFDRELGD